jgi:hypothetical protein
MVSKQHSVIAAQLIRQSANDYKAQKKMSLTISHRKEAKQNVSSRKRKHNRNNTPLYPSSIPDLMSTGKDAPVQ